ncbi:MAG: alpha-1,4-glucan--maltose-1-phosphate maltosyltransferase [Pseudomonadota bacterium]
MNLDGRKRVVIENVTPEINGGRFSIKRAIGEKVIVRADIFADGHDDVSACLLYRKTHETSWREVSMKMGANDRWEGMFTIEELCMYYYTVQGWIDRFATWQKDVRKKIDAGQDISVDILTGTEYISSAAKRGTGNDTRRLKELSSLLREEKDISRASSLALGRELAELMNRYPDKSTTTTYDKELCVVVDRKRAIFSAWYELFPRSTSPEAGRPGTLKDCERLVPEIAQMGFDVLYLPPIHPIGKTHRKGKNNAPTAQADDPGSPWAIGSEEGGHKSIYPSLGTIEDFERLIEKADEFGIDIAMDLAYQCSPDHPYVQDHPEWFTKRPDGTIQHAENPPKKYEDIVPFNFETEQWMELWEELKSIVLFWIERGIRIFRLDNPHTKPFGFWEWLIREIKNECPEVIFLSEAFTRPTVMNRLAKVGFTQSYTYFTWRNTKQELIEYLDHLIHSDVREYLRPNFWPNTPDILPEYLQYGGPPAFMIKLVLAATLSSNYGIFGPAFERGVNEALPGKEEYLNSEKYEIRHWDWEKPGTLKELIAAVNRIRRENPALQTTWNVKFYDVSNEYLLCYGKAAEDLSNIILVVVNLDPYHTQHGWISIPSGEWKMDPHQPYLAHDLITDYKYIWHGERDYVEINPSLMPAHIFRIHRKLRREADFDYFM